MPKNNKISSLDQSQCVKQMFDEENDAQRVSLVSGLDVDIELNHKDGDSVYSVRRLSGPHKGIQNKTTKSIIIEEVNCEDFSQYCLYGKSQGNNDLKFIASVEVSPDAEGDNFYKIYNYSISGRPEPQDLCAKRIRLVSDDTIEYQVEYDLIMKA